jgi:DNA-binding response OmpR family regulator
MNPDQLPFSNRHVLKDSSQRPLLLLKWLQEIGVPELSDEYFTKISECFLRDLHSLTRSLRQQHSNHPPVVYNYNYANSMLSVRDATDNRPLLLTPLENKFLNLHWENYNQFVPHHTTNMLLWNERIDLAPTKLRMLVKRLRDKIATLGDFEDDTLEIVGIHYRGFRLTNRKWL